MVWPFVILPFNAQIRTSLKAFNAESGMFPFSIPMGEAQSSILDKKLPFIKLAFLGQDE